MAARHAVFFGGGGRIEENGRGGQEMRFFPAFSW